MNIESKLEGRYVLTVHREDGSVKATHEFPNMILNQGLDRMGQASNSGVLTSFHVGAGSTPVQPTDTGLAAPIATVTWGGQAADNGYVAAEKYHWRSWSQRFGQGKAAGNLTEVAIGWATSDTDMGNGKLFSRALILDANGQPTTLVISANEFLTLTYELRNYVPTGDVVTTATIDGVERTVTIRPANNAKTQDGWGSLLPAVNPYNGGQSMIYDGIVPCTGVIKGENSMPDGQANINQSPGRVWSAYVPGSYRRECVCTYTIGQVNHVHNSYLFVTGIGQWQVGISPPLTKDNTMEVKINLAVSWGRYTP